MTDRHRAALADLGCAALVAATVLGPLFLGPGYWLVGDMVFVPQQPWKAAWLGLDGALPRSVPMDALVSVATQVVPGTWVQRALLLGGLLLGGLGMGRLTRELPWYGRAASIVLLLWNPWVYERLLIGQWAILLGYLALPWVALAARRLRADPRRGWPHAAVVVAVSAVCGPASGAMAVLTLGLLGLTRDRGTWVGLAVAGLLGNLTWAVPAATAVTAEISVEGVFTAFAARAESAAGLLPSLLSLGGIWKTSIVPPERGSAVVVALSCLVTVAAVLGVRRTARGRPGESRRWLVLGATALTVAALPALAGGAATLEWVADPVPGLALVRDSHRFLAPLGLVVAFGVGGAAVAVRERVRPGREALWAVTGLLVVAPALLLPGLAWGAAGELRRSSYPEEWHEVRRVLEDEPGATVVLPWSGSYRGFDWNHGRAVLDPAPRFFPGRVLVDDRVYLDEEVIPAEDPDLRAVRTALAAADPAAELRALGVRWVLAEQGAAGLRMRWGAVRHDGEELTLVDLADGGPVAAGEVVGGSEVPGWRRSVVLAGHVVTGGLLLLAATAILRRRE